MNIKGLSLLADDMLKDELSQTEEECKNAITFESVKDFYKEFLFKSINFETFEESGYDKIYVNCPEIRSVLIISNHKDNYKKKDKDKNIVLRAFTMEGYLPVESVYTSILDSVYVAQNLICFHKDQRLVEDKTMILTLMSDKQFIEVMRKAERLASDEDAQA